MKTRKWLVVLFIGVVTALLLGSAAMLGAASRVGAAGPIATPAAPLGMVDVHSTEFCDVPAKAALYAGNRSAALSPGSWDCDRVGAPRVISDTGQYRMWYDGMQISEAGWIWAVGLADSWDGATWTKHRENPVLSAGSAGGWDSDSRVQVSILKDGATYKMWYSGSDGGPTQTGYATSADGAAWTIFAGNPVLTVGPTGSWDEFEADAPSVIKDGGVYRMWYHGCDEAYTACSIGRATSANGTTWTKHPGNPVLTGTPGGFDEGFVTWPIVLKNGSLYEMWYTSFGSGIGRATSPDGIVWTKDPSNPVLPEGPGGTQVVQPTVMLEGGTYRMWFRYGAGGEVAIGYATSSDGRHWTLSEDNPVLTPCQTWSIYLPLILRKG